MAWNRRSGGFDRITSPSGRRVIGPIDIKSASVFDGESVEVFPATVVVEGQWVATDGATGNDATATTLMPGMVEGHCHPSFTGINSPPELGVVPPERHMLLTVRNCRLLLDHGFTSFFEAASARPLLRVTARDIPFVRATGHGEVAGSCHGGAAYDMGKLAAARRRARAPSRHFLKPEVRPHSEDPSMN